MDQVATSTLRHFSGQSWLLVAGLLVACGSSDTTNPVGGAGSAAIGGSSNTSSRTGGSSAVSSAGGGLFTGGSSAISVSGGATSSGGAVATGGAPVMGGSNAGGGGPNGGALATGGTRATGGAAATGGSVSTGGSRTTGGTVAAGGNSGLVTTGGAALGGASATGGSRPAGGASTTGGSRATGGAVATGGSSSGSTTNVCPGATQTITVDKSGTGQFTTVQAAINSISSSNSKLIEVYVKAGTYAEQVTINRPFVCLVGDSPTTTKITHVADTNILTGGTVILTGNDFSAANIAFENTAGNGAGQAVALMAQGARQQFSNCRFLSYQDTLYTNTGTQYFKNCYIQGDTDYIFGDATAVFENCTMNNIAQGTAVTAPRTPQNTTYGLVFIGGSLTATNTTSSVPSGSVYLGRPWGPYGAVAFLNVALGAHINAAGWTTMSSNTLANVRFYEYKSTGSGANPTNATRASRQLTDAQAANYTVAKVLSPWVPGYSQ
jgi:pectin methylesterase-like acyl-CoA thioesterase